MIKIIGIHGVAHTFLTAPQIEQQWLPAIQGGLEEAGFPRIQPNEFKIAAYGTKFRPERVRSGTLPRWTTADFQDEWKRAMLIAWWREASRLSQLNCSKTSPLGEDPTIQSPDFEGRGRTPHAVQTALRQLAKSKYFRALGADRVVLFLLNQVKEYLHNPQMKQEIQDCIIKEVTPDTRVIIGHSLGSVIAYECLCVHPEWNVETFVTIGSPLGMSPIIFDTLTPAPESGKGIYPNVKRWFNVADKGDIVALEKALAPRFGAVEDRLVHNGWESHSATRYLNAKETGSAIATGLFET